MFINAKMSYIAFCYEKCISALIFSTFAENVYKLLVYIALISTK